jgi:hypothetical protein
MEGEVLIRGEILLPCQGIPTILLIKEAAQQVVVVVVVVAATHMV